MGINRALLPIKAHYFLFFAAVGPILPQLTVYGKELGISSVVMGTVTAILPIMFFLAKPVFGAIVDVCRNYRKCIFVSLIVIMTIFYATMYFIPVKPLLTQRYEHFNYSSLEACSPGNEEIECTPESTPVVCKSGCLSKPFPASLLKNSTGDQNGRICTKVTNLVWDNSICNVTCEEDENVKSECLYHTLTFWGFIILMFVGSIAFNVINSISDAICFDVIGEDGDYGRQRVWGTVGYGIAALLSGYISSIFSKNGTITYAPAFILMIVFCTFDIITCTKLQLPIIEAPKNIFKEFKNLLNNAHVAIFLTFATFIGILDSIIAFFLFWYLEDLAVTTNTENVKLIEGFTVGAQTLFGEIIFFSVAGKILKRFGHVNSFSACFVFYAFRLGFIALAPSPWWIVMAELCFSGPTYAMAYSVIVAYANELAPPGASATMQGIAAGMDDGFGFCIGSFVAGALFKYIGAKTTFYIFSLFGLLCAVAHVLLHKILPPAPTKVQNSSVSEYKTPQEAFEATT